MATNGTIPSVEELVARSKALAPKLRARSERCETLRRVPEETIADFLDAGFHKMMQPKRFGGYEYGWDVLCECAIEWGRGCGSQAWVMMVYKDHVQKIGMCSVELQDEIWGEDPTALLSSFMYFREHSFNRVADLSQFGFDVEPAGCTMLVAEVSCDTADRYWTDDAYAKQAVLDDLVRERIVEAGDLVEMHVFRAEHAYPVYTLDYERHRDLVLQAIARTANMETAGRQGRFAYINTHIAMKMGYEAADRLMAGRKGHDDATDPSAPTHPDTHAGRRG